MPPLLWVLLAAWHAAACAVSFTQYALDKRAARLARRRIPETRLHAADLLGGWPAGLLARRLFHHKTRKRRFVAVFWLTAALHIAAAATGLYATLA
ncbi:MAG: DUF1294 domain-containing protein [Planctomycetota bacterium]|nr:MAG: DUF1294 domain-containing protein [Planctomycetota bacterium]